jgi:hypothetical protein
MGPPPMAAPTATGEPVEVAADPDASEEERAAPDAAGVGPPPMAAPPLGTRRAGRRWPTIMAMLAILGMFRGGEVRGFRAYDCANATNRVDV